MTTKNPVKTTFEVDKLIQPIFTGGAVSLENAGRIFATTLGEDVVLTDLTTGLRLAEIEGDGESISTLKLTPSASHLIVCSRSLSTRIYVLSSAPDLNSVNFTLVRTLKPHGTPVVVLAVDKTSTLLATGAADGTVKVWDIAGGYVTHTFRGPSVLVSALLFFEIAQQQDEPARRNKKQVDPGVSNFRLASGFQDGHIRVWDLAKRGMVAVDQKGRHVSNVQGLDFAPASQLLVTGSRDKTIAWWKWESNMWKPQRIIQCSEVVEAVGYLEDGQFTYSAGSMGRLRLWDTSTGRELTKERAARGDAEAMVSAQAVSDRSIVLAVQADHTLTLYQPTGLEKKAKNLVIEPFRRISGTHDDILDLAYLLPDRSMMALATNSDNVRLISIAESSEAQTASKATKIFGEDVALLQGHQDMVVTLDVDWSGHWMATGAKDNSARVWRVDGAGRSFTCHAEFTGHAESLGAVALPKQPPPEFSEAFRDPLNHPPAFLLTGSKDQTIKKWEIPRQSAAACGKVSKAVYTRKAHEKDINSIDVNVSGRVFASASQDKTIKIWDVEIGEVQGILRGHRRGVWSVKFAPPDMPAIQGGQGPVPGKAIVLTGSTDKTIKLWNLNDYTCLKTFEGHSNSVLCVAWLKMPEEQQGTSKKPVQFASAGADGLVKIWDANLGETQCTLDNHEGRIWSLAVHPQTNAIVSGSEDSNVTFWKDTTAETQAAASQAIVKLIEQEQELENFIRTGSYLDAIVLALQLNHPGRLLNLFTHVVTTDKPEEGSLCGLKAVDMVLASLSDEQLFLLLLRLRDWNTNAKTAPIAQRILGTLVKSYPAAKFSSLSVQGARGQRSLKEVLETIKVYTERHFKRLDELLDESYLVEYTLQEMDSLAPPLEDELAVRSKSRDTVMPNVT